MHRLRWTLSALAGLGLSCASARAVAGEGGGRPLTEQEIAAGAFLLRSGRLAATLMVPDRPASPYVGQRFEGGAVVMQVTLDGQHTFLGKERRTDRRGGIGLIEEIGISAAVAYELAKPGEEFLKLGVGLLRRDDDPGYRFWIAYPAAERFPWEVAVAAQSAAFVQVGKPFRGTAYRYEKRVVLDADLPVLRIEHALANTGEKPIATDQYCHNFLRFDDAPPGPDYAVTADFALKPQGQTPPFDIAGRSLMIREAVKDALYGRFVGQDAALRSHALRATHKGNGREAAITGDFPVAYLAYYVDPGAISPEAFCAIRVAPGDTFRWTRTYAFK